MKKLLALLMAALMLASLCACGTPAQEAQPATEADPETEAAPETEAPATEAPETEPETEAPRPESTQVSLGETIKVDFVEITFEEVGIAADIKQSVKTGNVTRITGPDPEDGMQFIYLRGTIKNIDKSELPVYDFFTGEFDLDGYTYQCTANQCDILDGNGQTQSKIAPLTTYTFTIYAKIPDELANSHSSETFRFGFYDLFENSEMAKNRSFEDDPISLCPYYYSLKLK